MGTRTLVLAALVLGASGCRDESRELRPDLVQVRPGAVSIVHEGGRDRLVFLSAVENVGPGPLVIAGSRASGMDATMDVAQTVLRADGSERRLPVDGELHYVVSETHRHWHLVGFERYEVRTLAGRRVGTDRKTGFCLGDRYDAHGGRRLANEPARPVFWRECGRDQPTLRRLRQGISPGYGDDYVPALEGQYVDVTGVPPGRYRLVHEVNPERVLRETDYGNNSASVVVRLVRNVNGSLGVEVENERRP